MPTGRLTAENGPNERAEEAKMVLRWLQKSRSALDNLQYHHASAYVDIAVQLLKQSIADDETAES